MTNRYADTDTQVIATMTNINYSTNRDHMLDYLANIIGPHLLTRMPKEVGEGLTPGGAVFHWTSTGAATVYKVDCCSATVAKRLCLKVVDLEVGQESLGGSISFKSTLHQPTRKDWGAYFKNLAITDAAKDINSIAPTLAPSQAQGLSQVQAPPQTQAQAPSQAQAQAQAQAPSQAQAQAPSQAQAQLPYQAQAPSLAQAEHAAQPPPVAHAHMGQVGQQLEPAPHQVAGQQHMAAHGQAAPLLATQHLAASYSASASSSHGMDGSVIVGDWEDESPKTHL